MSLAVRLFVIDYAFIHSSGKKRQQNFPPRSVFFWVLMVSWRVTGNIVIRRIFVRRVYPCRRVARSVCPLHLHTEATEFQVRIVVRFKRLSSAEFGSLNGRRFAS